MKRKISVAAVLMSLSVLTSLFGCATTLSGTTDLEKGNDPPAFEQIDTENKNVQIARELLTEEKSVKARMAQGTTLLYTGERQTIEERDCLIFALGTDHEGQFVREQLYGVCDNLIFSYDVITDTWSALGTE